MSERKNSKNYEHRRRKMKKKYARRKFVKLCVKRFTIIFVLAVVLFSFAIVFKMALNSVFRVKNINVQGSTLYDDSEVIEASGIKIGDSLIFKNSKFYEENIYKNLDYIDSVNIKKDFFGNITINLEPAKILFSIVQDEKYYLVSERNKVLGIMDELPPEVVVAQGIKFEISENKIKYNDEIKKQLFFKILENFKEYGLNYVRKINVSNCESLEVVYDDRLNILLGSEEDLKYKISTAKEIITGKLSATDRGTLDFRSLNKENRSYFIPDKN
ncbi:MAG: cell division protein FtsQ/DivIB [Acutalibacteraceae bacterium]